MLAKFDRFRLHPDASAIATAPRLFARNVTLARKQPTRARAHFECVRTLEICAAAADFGADQQTRPPVEIRLAPTRRPTAEPPTSSSTPTTRAQKPPPATTSAPKTVAAAQPKPAAAASARAQAPSPPLAAMPPHSTTTKIADMPTTTQRAPPQSPSQPKAVEIAREQKLKTPPPLSESERTTRSSAPSGASAAAAAGPTTPNARRTTPTSAADSQKLKIRATTTQSSTAIDETPPSTFPWYVVTLAGFCVSLAVFALVYWLVCRYRRRRAATDRDSLPHASLDSSRISTEAMPNEGGNAQADALLVSGGKIGDRSRRT